MMGSSEPVTRYAKSGDVNIAYQVLGDGPVDVVYVPGWVSNVELNWEEPNLARFLRRLASFSRVIMFDKRGTGLSDRVQTDDLPTLEERMDDVRIVMDAVGSERAALVGTSEGGPMCALFGATYPERTSAVVMFGSYARGMPEGDYAWGASRRITTPATLEATIRGAIKHWGEPVELLGMWGPSLAQDERRRAWFARYLRMSASPTAAAALVRMNVAVDITHILPAIQVPTLLLHRADDTLIDPRGSRYMAERIPGAKYVELPGAEHLWFFGDQDAVLDEIEEFLTGARQAVEHDRVLATVMFTDIVGSTERAASMGDRGWRELLSSHEEVVRGELERFRGQEVKTLGDGFLATFDGPARGIRCARAICERVEGLGIQVRAGLHAGECELRNGDVTGIAVHTAARVSSEAGAGEVLVSSTVKDLVAGSGIEFADRGTHSLRGIPGEWRLFSVSD
jgi:class 3 adenylate cyclase/pimeloyl-ACP methyl ester carboxylesterase